MKKILAIPLLMLSINAQASEKNSFNIGLSALTFEKQINIGGEPIKSLIGIDFGLQHYINVNIFAYFKGETFNKRILNNTIEVSQKFTYFGVGYNYDFSKKTYLSSMLAISSATAEICSSSACVNNKENGNGFRLELSHQVTEQFEIYGSYTKVNFDTLDQKLKTFGADYAFSKNNHVYFEIGSNEDSDSFRFIGYKRHY